MKALALALVMSFSLLLVAGAAADPLPRAKAEEVGLSSEKLANRQVGVEKLDPVTGKTVFYTVPAESEMTIQDLLRHTSGFTSGNRGTTHAGFVVPADKKGRLAQALAIDPDTGKEIKLFD